MTAPTDPRLTRAPRPRRSPAVETLRIASVATIALAIAVGGAVVAMKLYGHASPTAVSSPSSPTPARSPLLDDPVGQRVCPVVIQLNRTSDFYDVDKMETLGVDAHSSTNFDLSSAGGVLTGKARIAKASKGRDGELQSAFDMATAGTALATLCMKHGYR